jgi:hypothetical membrane protein
VTRRGGALAGIGAPVSFVGGWVLAGSQAPGYSPVRDHISDLAAVGAPTRPLMTAGLLGFGALAPFWAATLGRGLEDRAVRWSVTAAAVGTVGVAALPLGASWGDGPHAVAAGASYLAMAGSPLWGGRALARQHRRAAAVRSYATAAASAALLTASLVAGDHQGALQRAGLGVVDAWFVAMAVRELRR